MVLSTLRRTVAAVAASIAAILALSAPVASASRAAAPNHRVHYGTSTNWAGYALSGFGPYTSVSSSWTQRAVDCAKTANGYSAFWVGLDGAVSNTVEQTGTEANCSGGVASYAAWYEMYPKRSFGFPNPVLPGDSFTASVTALAKGRFQLTLTDNTQKWTASTTQRRRSAKRASAEVIAEAPSSGREVLPLADFGTIPFSGASANGSPLGGATPGIEPLTMQSGATVKATPSSISGGTFSVTWAHE